MTGRSSCSRARLGVRRTFQRVQTFGWLTVEDNVLTALEWRGGGGGFVADLIYFPTRRRRERERRKLVEQALQRCGLTAVRNELAGSLPIGIARMVELARAIGRRATVAAARRAGVGARRDRSRSARRTIQSVRETTGCSVLLVEHNAGFVMEHSDRVVVLDLGAVLAEGSPSEIQAERGGARRVPGRSRRCGRELVDKFLNLFARDSSPARSTRSWRRASC